MNSLKGATLSWRDKNDYGLECVASIHSQLKIGDYWAIDVTRGFMWWPEEFAQKIWSDMGMFHNAQSVFRLHAETEFIRAKGHAEDFELTLAEHMGSAILSAVCLDSERDIYILHTSAYLTLDNAEWLFRLFMAAVAMQLHEAHGLGKEVAKAIGACPAASEHPTHSFRSPPDPILKSVDQFFVPYGKQPSRWIGLSQEWKYVEWAMERQATRFESDHSTYCKAEFPWHHGEGVVRLLVTTDEPHPYLGNGLTMKLQVPAHFEPKEAAHHAMRLNNIERKEWLRCQMMGSWGFDAGQLQYECFVPNTSYHLGILENLSLSMSVRSQWINEEYPRLFSA